VFRLSVAVFLLLRASSPAFSQAPTAALRLEVTAESAAVAGATVTVHGGSVQTDASGVAVTPAPLGTIEVSVTKEDSCPAARHWRSMSRANGRLSCSFSHSHRRKKKSPCTRPVPTRGCRTPLQEWKSSNRKKSKKKC
jgi:hypothetical protein